MSERPADPIAPFDAGGPLPTGSTLLEASAGTGKTHAIGDLVTRYVAEGVARPDQLLVITFGRTASQELRERVRGHLVRAERSLADPAGARTGADPVHALLADGDDELVRARRERLRGALAGYDASTILTTHQFCQFVLTGLGVAGDADPDVELVETLDDLVVQVVDDLYVGAFARLEVEPVFTRDTALALARRVIDDPQAELQPLDADSRSRANWRVRFGERVRREVEERKRQRRILGYDDLLVRLAAALEPDDAPARTRMRRRWSCVLVDEFQDTDPVQWQILDRAFTGHATMILIGDPKQSIYAFRGGDVQTYLTAARTTGRARATLASNWRTDPPLVAALQVLLHDLALGSPEIRVRPVVSALPGSRLLGAPSAAPLRLRVIRRDDVGLGAAATIPIDRARHMVARDLASDLAELLDSGARFDDRTVRAGHVAVIVGTHRQARLVQAALLAAEIPAVVAGSSSVFQTDAADHWVTLLEALEQPHRAPRVRAAALTAFVGRSAADLAAGGEATTDELSVLTSGWAGVLAARGVAALLEVVSVETGLPARVLGVVGGERLLTDLRHIGQLLQSAALEEGLGVAALVEWLRRRRADDRVDVTSDRVRRLETDAAATQVVTLHASKGLQYPVVYLPFAFDRWVDDKPDVLLLHHDGRRILDIGGPDTPGRGRRRDQALAEEAGEALRHLYVGLTRAQSQVVTWWAPTKNTVASGLHRVLFGERDFDGGVPDVVRLPSDEVAATRLTGWQQRGALVLEPVGITAPRPRPAPAVDHTDLAVAVLDRDLEQRWRRVSYSSLAAAGSSGLLLGPGAAAVEFAAPIGDPGVASEPEFTQRDDEEVAAPLPVPIEDGSAARLRSVPSPMADLPVGATFGTLVHAVFETTDPQAVDLPAEVRVRCAEQLARVGFPLDPGPLAAALVPVLRTPLGPLADGLALTDLGTRDRLTELDFELPLAGGDRGGSDLTLDRLAPVIRRGLPPDDPLAGYAERLASPAFAGLSLRGYLTGSLDAVLRLPGERYLVADYKTNWLGDFDTGAPLSLWDYRPEALEAVMAGSDYPLQAMLYTVALHRFLRWRQPGYHPARHIAGVLYLFVRGMAGPDTPAVDGRPCGVFGWAPPVELITGLSDLLDGTDPIDGADLLDGADPIDGADLLDGTDPIDRRRP
ncbi:MAG TPA: UvrD-helicase domain-containing protein [Nakamurella sp.]